MDSEAYALIQRRLAALERRVSALFRTGRVAEVQLDPYRVRVDVGPDDDAPVVTDLVPVLVPRSGEVRTWTPLTVGERVAVLSPGGEDASAFVLPALISADFEAASDAAGRVVRRYSALGEPETEVARIEVVRGTSATQSSIRLQVGISALTLRGDGAIALTNGTSSMTMDLADVLVDAPHIGLND